MRIRNRHLLGYATSYLAAGLIGDGKVYSFDIYPHAGRHIPRTLRQRVELHRGKPSIEAMPPILERATPDIFFQDSRHDYIAVVDELRIVAPYLKARAVVLFRDFVLPTLGVQRRRSCRATSFILWKRKIPSN